MWDRQKFDTSYKCYPIFYIKVFTESCKIYWCVWRHQRRMKLKSLWKGYAYWKLVFLWNSFYFHGLLLYTFTQWEWLRYKQIYKYGVWNISIYVLHQTKKQTHLGRIPDQAFCLSWKIIYYFSGLWWNCFQYFWYKMYCQQCTGNDYRVCSVFLWIWFISKPKPNQGLTWDI